MKLSSKDERYEAANTSKVAEPDTIKRYKKPKIRKRAPN